MATKRNRSNPVALLFGAYRREVLAVLLLRPTESFHVREIARLANVPAGSLHRELKRLEEADLLRSERSGNLVRYRANTASPIYPELAEIFRKTSGLVDVLRAALEPFRDQIHLALVFGSMASGTEKATSDVDVLVIGDVGFGDVVKSLSPAQERFGREINPVVVTREDARLKLGAGDRFFSRIASEPKLFLIGSEDEFRELSQDWKA